MPPAGTCYSSVEEGTDISKVIELSDEEYHTLEEAAKKRRETPEQTLKSLVRALAEAEGPVYFCTDEMFAALDAYAADVGANRG